jgi:SAM-dependent methyltransferase
MLRAELAQAPFLKVDLCRDDIPKLGRYDLVVCSNVLEHLSEPHRLLGNMATLLKPSGFFYLSWTNWLSPWGGHSFSPFHYLGPRKGHLIYDKLRPGKRRDTPFENLYPTYIGSVLKVLRGKPELRVLRVAPRYYPELSFIVSLPVIREFLCWNCAVLMQKRA